MKAPRARPGSRTATRRAGSPASRCAGHGWRGMAAGSDKTLFRLPGGSLSAPRLIVVEAAIDALSLAALEGPRADTLYLATAGGIGPGTMAALGRYWPRVPWTQRQSWSRPAMPIRPAIAMPAASPSWRRPPACARPGCGRRTAAGDWNELLVRARRGQGSWCHERHRSGHLCPRLRASVAARPRPRGRLPDLSGRRRAALPLFDQ